MPERPFFTGLLTLALAVGTTSSSPAQTSTGIERVAWLKGCWESSSPQRVIDEQWMAPRAKSMLGMSRTVRNDRLAEYELVVIREEGAQLAYQAHPSGQASAVFLSTSVTGSTVVFENAEHDFPKRIGYERSGADSLLAWIEGTDKGQVRRIEYPYRRGVCPAN